MKNILFLSVGLSLFLTSHLFSATQPKKNKKVEIALNWVPEPEFGGFYAVQKLDLLKQKQIDLSLLPGVAGTPTIQMLQAGKVDFAIVSGDEIIISQERGADIVGIFSVYQTSPLMIMAHQSRGLKKLSDV